MGWFIHQIGVQIIIDQPFHSTVQYYKISASKHFQHKLILTTYIYLL